MVTRLSFININGAAPLSRVHIKVLGMDINNIVTWMTVPCLIYICKQEEHVIDSAYCSPLRLEKIG